MLLVLDSWEKFYAIRGDWRVWVEILGVWAKKDGSLGKDGRGSGQTWGGFWAKKEGGLGMETARRVDTVEETARRQATQRAVEDVARLAETGWDGGGGGGGDSGRGAVLPGGGRAGAMRTSGMCLQNCKRFGEKNAHGEDLWSKKVVVWSKIGVVGFWQRMHFVVKKPISWARKIQLRKMHLIFLTFANVTSTP